MMLAPGTRLRSQVCDAEVIVIRCGGDELDVTCGGLPMVAEPGEPDPSKLVEAHSDGTALGKRYTSETSDLEVLVVKGGQGSLAANGTRMKPKASKALPASD